SLRVIRPAGCSPCKSLTPPAAPETTTLSLHDALPIFDALVNNAFVPDAFELFEDVDLDKWRHIFDVNVFGSLQLTQAAIGPMKRSEEHTSELQSRSDLVCRLLREKKSKYLAVAGVVSV